MSRRRNAIQITNASTFDSPDAVITEIERTVGSPRLSVELVPAATWGSNLRSALRPSDWNRLRKSTYEAANRRCEVCGGQGRQHPVECHERWQFDDTICRQPLIGLIALCPECHDVKHFGRAEAHGRGPMALLHLSEVNRWPIDKAQRYLKLVFALWTLRTKRPWQLDLSWLAQFGISVRGSAT
jgi:hypothetical protein